MNFNKYLFRCHSVGHIMTNLESITEKQLERLAYLESRPKPTDNQLKEIEKLKAKRDAPDQLPSGAITHLKDIYNSEVYDIREEIRTDALEKGHLCEQDGLDLVGKLGNTFLVKNEKLFKNTYIAGTPDCIHGAAVIDIKSSFKKRSFDAADFKNIYYWQLMAYMWLTGKKFAMLAYCLNDTPEHIIIDEIRRTMYREGEIDEMSEKGQAIEQQVRLNNTFDRIPANNRVKTFYAEFDQEQINHLKRRVRMARQWLNDHHKELARQKPEIRFYKPRSKKL